MTEQDIKILRELIGDEQALLILNNWPHTCNAPEMDLKWLIETYQKLNAEYDKLVADNNQSREDYEKLIIEFKTVKEQFMQIAQDFNILDNRVTRYGQDVRQVQGELVEINTMITAIDEHIASIDSRITYLTEHKVEVDTVKYYEVPNITNEETLRTHFYELRKAHTRSFQFEIKEGFNENIIAGLGGYPQGTTNKEQAFIYIDLPYSEAGGFMIKATYEGRTSSKLFEQYIYSTLNANWSTTGWINVKGENNLIVNTTANPIAPDTFICDYNSDEIRKARDEGRSVVMYFTDNIEGSGDQAYPLLRIDQDGAHFRRVQVIDNDVRQIDINVDYDKNVTFNIKVLNGEYELIESFTMQDDAILNKTTEPDGTPYNFSNILIKMEFEAVALNIKAIRGGFKNGDSLQLDYIVDNNLKKRYLMIKMFAENGYWSGKSSNIINNYYNNINFTHIAIPYTNLFKKAGNTASITKIFTGGLVPRNTKIEIWGIRDEN